MNKENWRDDPPARLTGRCPANSIDREKRRMEIVICTSERDRQGDIVEIAGLDFSNYLANPVLLWAHDTQRPPVGRVLEITPGINEITALAEFADTPFAREVFDLYAGGYLNAWSIGFIPKRWKRLQKSEGEGYHILAAEIVEISAVPVPANAQALTKALAQINDPALLESLAPTSSSAEENTSSECDNDNEDLPQDEGAAYEQALAEFTQQIFSSIETIFSQFKIQRRV